MIRKTIKEFKRMRNSYEKTLKDMHAERVVVETWWLLFIPIYSRESIIATNL